MHLCDLDMAILADDLFEERQSIIVKEKYLIFLQRLAPHTNYQTPKLYRDYMGRFSLGLA